MTTRRLVLLGAGAALAGCASNKTSPAPQDQMSVLVHRTPPDVAPLQFSGQAIQGGALIGKAPWGGAMIRLGLDFVGRTSRDGYFVIGFDRDSASLAPLAIGGPNGAVTRNIDVAPGDYDIQRIDGLPQDTVTPEAPETLAKIAAEAERKAAGFASNVDADWFRDGFDMPLVATRVSGRFGGQRILNGTPSRPHYGADLAAPTGTPVHAPCDGLVSFAETGLHYEGGLIMIDHGQGLVTAYLHLSKVETAKGAMVRRGQKIGEVGAEGRATGPHLCWRMKWRNRNCDPTLLVGVQAPIN